MSLGTYYGHLMIISVYFLLLIRVPRLFHLSLCAVVFYFFFAFPAGKVNLVVALLVILGLFALG
uniref:Uncharacterized protein n=1 Tax=Manihot esculenta TaxID=3983 RepID=A0A2C9WF18_MANES